MGKGEWKKRWLWVYILAVGMGWGNPLGVAQVKTYTPGEYPAPRTPAYKVDATVEELMPIARVVVRKPSEQEALTPGYAIKAGQRVLILVTSSFDDRVLEAIRRAIEEAGGKPDVMKSWAPERRTVSANQGHEEIRQYTASGTPQVSRTGFPKALQAASKTSPAGAYDMVLNGSGGPVPVTPFGWEYIPWDTVDKFMFSQAGLPHEVQKAIDDKFWDMVLKARKIHVVDPEGTDLSWKWQPNFASLLREEFPQHGGTILPGHLGAFPEFLSPKDAEATGQIAGTINHTGSYPRIVLTLKNNEIVKIEGGGEYGKRWQSVLDMCRGTQFPGFPGPGCGWLEEAAVGSDPWRARSLSFADYTGEASWERGRTGVIHWGLGTSRNVAGLPHVEKWFVENKSPVGGSHWHVHTYFNTMDLTREDGKQFRLIDKGHLTLLDDPEVRKIASKFGNPDELLQEKWIPGVPGINLPGNYLTDYAPDPYQVIKAQMSEARSKRPARTQ